MQAVCGPSRASLLSGRRPDITQMWNFVGSFRDTPGAASWNTLPEWFLNHGYYTAGCGKLFHPGDPANFDPRFGLHPASRAAERSCSLPFRIKRKCGTHHLITSSTKSHLDVGRSWSTGAYSGYFGQGTNPCRGRDKGRPVPDNYGQDTNGGCPVDPQKNPDFIFPDVQTLGVASDLVAALWTKFASFSMLITLSRACLTPKHTQVYTRERVSAHTHSKHAAVIDAKSYGCRHASPYT